MKNTARQIQGFDYLQGHFPANFSQNGNAEAKITFGRGAYARIIEIKGASRASAERNFEAEVGPTNGSCKAIIGWHRTYGFSFASLGEDAAIEHDLDIDELKSHISNVSSRLHSQIRDTSSKSIVRDFLIALDSKKIEEFISARLGFDRAIVGNKMTAEGLDCFTSLRLFDEPKNSHDTVVFLETDQLVMGARNRRLIYGKACEVTQLVQIQNRPMTRIAFIVGADGLLIVSPLKSRDIHISLNRDVLEKGGWAASCLERLAELRLNSNQLVDLDYLFGTAELDREFFEICHDFRLVLTQDLLDKHYPTIHKSLKFLAPDENLPALKSLTRALPRNRKYQNMLLSVVDGLVLRTIIHRIADAYEGLQVSRYDSLLHSHTRTESLQKSEVGPRSKGFKSRFQNPKVLKPTADRIFKLDLAKIDEDYRRLLGGDLHASDLARAIDYLEESLSAHYLVELLDSTSAGRYTFRYEDLRTDALENFYEKSLETTIQFRVKGSKLEAVAVEDKIARKELGAYYTSSVVSKFVVSHSLALMLADRESEIDSLLKDESWQVAREAIHRYLTTNAVDPTAGGGSFLKAAFRELSSPSRLLKINKWLRALPEKHRQALFEQEPWLRKLNQRTLETFVISNCIYGVDFDTKSLSVSSQTLTLELLYLAGTGFKLPNLIGLNLKRGNALVSLFEKEEWRSIQPSSIAKLIALRAEIKKVARQEDIQTHLREERALVAEMLQDISNEKVRSWGFQPSELSAFAWEMEFPEVFFNSDGTPKDNPGFDCVLGNPPWENLRPYDEEFFLRIDRELPVGKNNKKAQANRISTLLKQPEIKSEYESYLTDKSRYSTILEKSNQFVLLAPEYENVGGGNGDPNTYKLAAEKYPQLGNSQASFGFLMPTGLLGDKGTRDLRRFYLNNKLISTIVHFEKTNDVFPDATQSFGIFCGGPFRSHELIRISRKLSSYQQLEHAFDNDVAISSEFLSTLPLETSPIITPTSKDEITLLEKLFAHKSPISFIRNSIVAYTELHTTNDLEPKGRTVSTKSRTEFPVIKGENLKRFSLPTETDYFARKGELSKKTYFPHIQTDRLAWGDVAGLTDARRMRVGVVPAGTACFNSLNVIRGFKTRAEMFFYLAVLNSTSYEFLIRLQSSNNHVNIFLVKLNPLPEFDPKNEKHIQIASHAQAIHKKYDASKECELDAKVARDIYRLSVPEFESVLKKFEKLTYETKQLMLKFAREG